MAYLVEDEEAIEGKSNVHIEKEITADLEDRPIPYTSKIEKVTVLDCSN